MAKPITDTSIIRSFGRLKGRKLNTAKQDIIDNILPQLLLRDFANVKNTWLEIGFGGGEHLVSLAQKNPEVNFIGCEVYLNGIAKILKLITEANIKNIKIFHGDARLLFEKIPLLSLDNIFILFPDPWPKARHHKKRLITTEFLGKISQFLSPKGSIHIATDHADYAQWIEEQITACTTLLTSKNTDSMYNIDTKYRDKAEKEGREPIFFNLVKVLNLPQ